MARLVLGGLASVLLVMALSVGGPRHALAQVPEAQPVPAEGVVRDEPATGQPPSDDEAARRHFRLGQAYYQNGQFPEAAAEFEQAYQLSGRPQLLYNIYLAHRDALHTRHVAWLFDEYWLVVDRLEAPTAHRYEQRFQLGEREAAFHLAVLRPVAVQGTQQGGGLRGPGQAKREIEGMEVARRGVAHAAEASGRSTHE